MRPTNPFLSRRALCAGLASLPLGTFALAAPRDSLTFADLYIAEGTQGLRLSPKVQNLAGGAVTMRGYMAPPLKAESDFFVLTRFPMSICPFCSSEADWPSDIVVVYLSAAARTLGPSQMISVSGQLETGAKMDPNTAFVSLVRIVRADWQTA